MKAYLKEHFFIFLNVNSFQKETMFIEKFIKNNGK